MNDINTRNMRIMSSLYSKNTARNATGPFYRSDTNIKLRNGKFDLAFFALPRAVKNNVATFGGNGTVVGP